METIQLVLHQEPVPPRLLQPKVPRDLETVCLKCLEKETARRYVSAEALAGDLGADACRLLDKVVAMFRRRALDWLRDDLATYDTLAGQDEAAVNQAIQQRPRHWRGNADLASVRDPQALDRLADDDRAAWQTLWRGVDELAERLAKKGEAAKGR
jgi:hypothetical protein